MMMPMLLALLTVGGKPTAARPCTGSEVQVADPTAMICDGVRGFFVPRVLFRGTDGMAERYLKYPYVVAERDALREQVRALERRGEALAATASVARAQSELWLRQVETQPRDWAGALWFGVGVLAGGAACVGVAHALPGAP